MADTKEKKPNILFDTLAALFNNKQYIQNLTIESIKQNSFMINRRLAIKYPMQAQVFNNSKVNPVDVLYFWSDYLYNGTFPPRWIYTAGAKKSQEKKESKKLISQSSLKLYCIKNNLSQKDVDAALKFFPDELANEITELENVNKILKNESNNF